MRDLYRSIAGCGAAGHLPDRKRVRSVSGDLVTSCRCCHTALFRYGPGDWREDDRARQAEMSGA